MHRRNAVLCIAAAIGAPRTLLAQSSARYRIAYLSGYSAEVDAPLLAAFMQGLSELGYAEGRNITIEVRRAGGRPDRVAALAAELMAGKPHVFVVGGSAPAAQAVKAVAGATPIVMANVQDPVASGLVTNLARPGGNITGMSDFHAASVTKRLELMKEAIPGLKLVGVLWNQDSATNARQLKDVQKAAPGLALKIVSLPVRKPDDLDGALASFGGQPGSGLLLLGDFVLSSNMKRIAQRAIQQRVPAVYTISSFIGAGGFMAYGTSFEDLWRRSAGFVDKILRGAKPGDLPIEQPTKFDLIINLRTAKAIGVNVPRALLLRADQVVE